MMITTKTHKQLENVLMEPEAPGIHDPYSVIEGEEQNIIVLPSGKNGAEFNKTDTLFHKYAGVQIYQCLYGQGVMVMQRNDELGEAKEFKIATLHSGRQVEVPASWGHSIANVGKTFLVVLQNNPGSAKVEANGELKGKRGFAYYIVEKKGEIGFEQNPNYHLHPQISTE